MGVSITAIGQPGFWQIVIVLAIFLLFFGSNRLPKMARSLGASLTEFKKGLRGEDDDEEEKKKVGTGDGDEAEAKDETKAKDEAK